MDKNSITLAKNILESAGYTITKINESWPPVLNSLGRWEKNRLRDRLLKSGYDIENLSSTDIQLTSGRDTRIKSGMTIVEFDPYHIAVWVNGENVVDTYLIGKGNVKDMAWRRILELNPKTYYMAFDAEVSAALRQKKADRRESQKGVVTRYTNGTKPRYSKIDKSGYIIDPQKYVHMFAEMSINQGSQILKNAKDLYVSLADKLDKVNFNDSSSYYNYDNVMRGLSTAFKDLSKSLAEYNKEVEKYKKLDPEDYDIWVSYKKRDVVIAIKDIRRYMKEAKQFEKLGEENPEVAGTED